jgi:hypothetical protein
MEIVAALAAPPAARRSPFSSARQLGQPAPRALT